MGKTVKFTLEKARVVARLARKYTAPLHNATARERAILDYINNECGISISSLDGAALRNSRELAKVIRDEANRPNSEQVAA
jgi:hypothetical protein